MSLVEPGRPDTTPRGGGFLSSSGVERSTLTMVIGLIGMVFLLLTMLGLKTPEAPRPDDTPEIQPAEGDIAGPVQAAASDAVSE